MTTTVQAILDRAKALNPLNSSLTSDRAEMLSRIRVDQADLFAQVALLETDYFQTVQAINSTSAASGRVVDTSGTTLPVAQILLATLADGTPLNRVRVTDPDAELAPRYYMRGKTLVEIGAEWSAASGIVPITITHVYGPTDIDPNGALTQTVTVPDEWTDLLTLPLALYLFQKDPGRDEAESQRLYAMLGEWGKGTGRRGAFVKRIAGYGGDRAITRFDLDS